jgi:hypothetical protein
MATTAAPHPIGAQFTNLKAIIAQAESDVVKFDEKHNEAAGTRVRKAMQALKVGAQGIRETVVQK